MRMPIVARLAGLSLMVSLGSGAVLHTTESVVQPASAALVPGVAPVPFSVGEVLTYKASFGGISAGSARMEVSRIDTLRGRPAYHVVFSIDGGIPFFRVHDRYESWIDVETLSSLKHVQRISEGRYKRETTYEMFPESSQYRRNTDPLEPSVPNPLDDGSFIYAVRAAAVKPGETRREDRYFRPDRNPVILTGVKYDTIKVAAGTFPSVVVRPTIRTKGIFSEGGDAQVWFSDDAHRIPVQVKTKFAKFSLTLSLTSVVYGKSATH
ncbi:MAG: DUF3108 domain-containing protein [Gemmatimonadaceae bacterium]|nr:DUF3108 domain-containing protein [Gemmatimonadaceae bacterium]